jgi:hypothetical protein
MASDPPKVLISYSHDSPEHKDRVLVLSNRLRGEGIDCTIDQYLLVPPEGWPRWMEKQIRESDFVLMVCTETYHRRVLGQPDPDRGRVRVFYSPPLWLQIFRNERGKALHLSSQTPPTKRQSEAFCSVSANFVLLES